MKSKSSLLFSFFLLFYTANAFNISQILSQYPDFSTFNNYLTQTQLSTAINGRQTITVLAVNNAAISPLSGKPTSLLKEIMSVHVVLDYYDVPKLQKLPNKTATLTTLFQSSGQAIGQQGFLNVAGSSTGSVAFGSAVKGSPLSANLVKSIVSQPYNISILQISAVIIPTGIDGSNTNSSTNSTANSPRVSPSTSPEKSPSTSPPQSSEAAPPSNATADSPAAETPTAATSPPQPSEAAPPSNANADSPAAETPTAATSPSQPSEAAPPSNATADSPVAETPTAADHVPVGSPPNPADGPTADSPTAGKPDSAGVTLRLSLRVVLMIGISSTLSLVSMT